MRRQIVVVDDEHHILGILSEVLGSEGLDAVTFVDAYSALTYMLAHPPALVITDLLMPALDGREFIRLLREQHGPDVPVVVMSASVNSKAVASLPVQAFVAKPFDLDDVVRVVARLLNAPNNTSV